MTIVCSVISLLVGLFLGFIGGVSGMIILQKEEKKKKEGQE